jgi:yecA family protein
MEEKNLILPGFSDIEKALEKINAESSAAETHGLLSSLFCCGAKLRQEAWVDSMLFVRSEPGDIILTEAKKNLAQLYDVTSNCFEDADYEFQLLLPDDEVEFSLRVTALAEWCQGFVTGLNLQGVSVESSNAGGDIKEALEDLLKMSCLRYEEEDLSDEESESAYSELVEYARVAVMTIYNSSETLANSKNEIGGNDTVH